jgi:hypothetical protein
MYWLGDHFLSFGSWARFLGGWFPFLGFTHLTWYGNRALSLWECENTLTVALDVCKAFLPALD